MSDLEYVDALGRRYRRTHPAVRLFSKVDLGGPAPEHRPDLGGCWLWTGATRQGYGVIRMGRPVGAHRVSYELLVGPVPEGLQLDHLCRVRHCVRPDHLEPVTSAENTRRGLAGHHNARKTHCVNGHEFTPENTRLKGGHRQCVECQRAADRRYAEKRRAA